MEIIRQHLLFAADAGYVLAMGDLGLMYMDSGNDDEALFWLTLAEKRSETGDPRKEYLYGNSAALLRTRLSDRRQADVLSRIETWEKGKRNKLP